MLTIRVQDEFAKLRTAIVHDGSNAIDISLDDWRDFLPPDELARHPESGSSSKARLVEQHARFRQVLADHRVNLLAPEPQEEAFGQVFARDPCFAIGDRLFVGGLCDDWRQAETTGLRDLRTRLEPVIDLSGDGATIEGGDVMVLDSGRRALVGMNHHTNWGGFRNLSSALAGSGIEVVAVPHEALHLDCCLAPLPNGEALYAADKLPESSVARLAKYFVRLIPLDPDEAARHLAANLFWLDRHTAVSGRVTTTTNAILRAKGYDVIELDFSDLVTLWGGFRCVVCPIEREPAERH
jgi:N-dimethylarginine dimethylaminohydrolase